MQWEWFLFLFKVGFDDSQIDKKLAAFFMILHSFANNFKNSFFIEHMIFSLVYMHVEPIYVEWFISVIIFLFNRIYWNIL